MRRRMLHFAPFDVTRPSAAPRAFGSDAGAHAQAPSPMALPAADPTRQLKHRRAIDVQVYACGGGLWQVDATLTDTKTRDVTMVSGTRPAGTPIHEMLLRVVVDQSLTIVDAGSETRWMPYTGFCERHGAEPGDAYGRLKGLNLMRGFRAALRERLGGVLGCTHISELAQVLPTAVIQAFAGEVLDTRGSAPDAQRPFQIDRCHALRSDGEVVRTYYPRWVHQPGAKLGNDNEPASAPST